MDIQSSAVELKALVHDMRLFAVELHQIAWSMPAGREHELLDLATRIRHRAQDAPLRAESLPSGNASAVGYNQPDRQESD